MQRRLDSTCGFEGNPDLYGLGIRLGVYLQWISASLIHGLGLQGRDGLMEVYIIFLLALTIATIATTIQPEPIHAVDIFLVMYIVFGGAYTVLITGYQNSNVLLDMLVGNRTKQLRALAALVILSAMSIYCSWFWLRGIYDNFLETPCGTYGFLFAKVSLFDPAVSKFFAFLSIFMAVGYTTQPIFVPVFLVVREFATAYAGDEVEVAESPDRARFVSYVPFFINGTSISAFTLAYSILGIELTIYWNSIRGVYSINNAGQLIPFVIGVVGFLKVIVHMRQLAVNGRRDAQQDAEAPRSLTGILARVL